MFRDIDTLLPLASTTKTSTLPLSKDADQILKSIALEAKVLIKVSDIYCNKLKVYPNLLRQC
jgi:hypothetical protein